LLEEHQQRRDDGDADQRHQQRQYLRSNEGAPEYDAIRLRGDLVLALRETRRGGSLSYG
jgi:hypothetical protein